MQKFSGFEYLLIDVANQAGHDKLRYQERIDWSLDNIERLEEIAENDNWKERPLYITAVKALRKAQRGESTGHLVGFDAAASGMQIMSAITGCESGAWATGLVHPDMRADAYGICSKLMTDHLGFEIPNQRNNIKNAAMTVLYGSQAEPKKEFGEDTPELQAFYKAMYQMAPGACDLLQALLQSWDATTLAHEWKLPDGFDVVVKVMDDRESRIRVEELNNASFTYQWKENTPINHDCKNAANVVHSLDAYLLRSVIRRCSYDSTLFRWTNRAITEELLLREMGHAIQEDRYGYADEKLHYYIKQYNRSTVVDVVILQHLNAETVCCLSTEHLRSLNHITETCLEHKPFDVVTVHDDFKCHPNNMNYLRKHYRNILAELAGSNVLDDLLTQLFKTPTHFPKKSTTLSDKIKNSNYAIC